MVHLHGLPACLPRPTALPTATGRLSMSSCLVRWNFSCSNRILPLLPWWPERPGEEARAFHVKGRMETMRQIVKNCNQKLRVEWPHLDSLVFLPTVPQMHLPPSRRQAPRRWKNSLRLRVRSMSSVPLWTCGRVWTNTLFIGLIKADYNYSNWLVRASVYRKNL